MFVIAWELPGHVLNQWLTTRRESMANRGSSCASSTSVQQEGVYCNRRHCHCFPLLHNYLLLNFTPVLNVAAYTKNISPFFFQTKRQSELKMLKPLSTMSRKGKHPGGLLPLESTHSALVVSFVKVLEQTLSITSLDFTIPTNSSDLICKTIRHSLPTIAQTPLLKIKDVVPRLEDYQNTGRLIMQDTWLSSVYKMSILQSMEFLAKKKSILRPRKQWVKLKVSCITLIKFKFEWNTSLSVDNNKKGGEADKNWRFLNTFLQPINLLGKLWQPKWGKKILLMQMLNKTGLLLRLNLSRKYKPCRQITNVRNSSQPKLSYNMILI